ncbi:KilA-N domain-containing protein [Sphingobacterium lactis]|uniref:KilA-N domain-containing protein n=2 Tax=Sphingobacterium lactis TaxID=797291 RepID=A0A1H6CQX9_9SPHI|nr:KilA-N domain-containing protein [Sphingobacterium lactis]
MFSLNGLYELAGSPKNKDPRTWVKQDNVKELIHTVSEILNVTSNHIIKSKRGKGGGTEAHRQIALSYAKYLDPKLHALVNEVFFERVEEEKNPDLIVDRAITTYTKKGYSPEWISKRITGKAARNEFTSTLKRHGVSGDGYQRCTNAMYIELYGKDASGVREKKGIPQKSNIRENMSALELQAIQFAEMLAKEDIEKNRRYGNEECAMVSNQAARVIKNSINQFRNR